jgi:hypothetical protein
MNCGSAPSGGSHAQTPPDPIRPKGTGNHTPPAGGNKPDQKPPRPLPEGPPKGGSKADPATPSPGNSGPILLRANGDNHSGMKSGSTGSASTRTNGRK